MMAPRASAAINSPSRVSETGAAGHRAQPVVELGYHQTPGSRKVDLLLSLRHPRRLQPLRPCRAARGPSALEVIPVAVKRWISLSGALLLTAIAIRFAEPLLDGDRFFHLAYARQMLDRHTLILDHTPFSWTPASNHSIYCAWLSELMFLGLTKIAADPVGHVLVVSIRD
jgi:hypothetical protein